MRRAASTALVGGLLAASLVAPGTALAQPPNDDIANARAITPPARVDGTVVDSTTELNEPGSACGLTEGSVWYQFKAPPGRRVVVLFDAGGDLDAAVDVFRRTRSRFSSVDCDASDSRGQATIEPDRLAAGGTYLIRVAAQAGSAPAGFKLEVLVPQPAPTPPGRRLPRRGVTNRVTRLVQPADAWSTTLRAGTTYRMNLDTRASRCTTLLVYPPGTRSFDAATPIRRLACGGYQLFTPGPGEGGRYTFLVQAARRERLAQPYHLAVAPAGPDDMSPGLFIGNHGRARGVLRAGGIDVIDLYRFDVVRRSALTLRLHKRGRLQLILLDDTGRRIVSDTTLVRRNVRRGRYFVAVRSDSQRPKRYTLTRISRTITRSRILINGKRHAAGPPGATARIGVAVSPAVSGTVRIDIERFDPLAGWQFLGRFSAPVVAGKAVLPFHPPSVGRYRARALFLRTRTAAASQTTPLYARLLVATKLQE